MIKVVQITTDSREHFKEYHAPWPYFGTAPEALLSGFSGMPGVEVHVVSCVRQAVASPEKLADNIYYHSLLIPRWGWGRSAFIGCVIAVRRLLREIAPDIIHGQGTERDCSLDAVLSGFPNVITIHGNMRVHFQRTENGRRLYYRLAASLETFCLRKTNGVIAISTYTQQLVQELNEKVCLLPNAVDERFFSVVARPVTVPRVLFVGSFCERKNPLALLEVCREMLENGECTIAFAGQGNPSNEYNRRFIAMVQGIRGAEILGFLGRSNLASELERTSVLVLPTFEDNCPMVVLEAMAAGVAVAASRVGGIPDLIQEGVDGLMFDPNDPKDLLACVEELIRNQEKRVCLARSGRSTALKRFHPRVIAEAHLGFYHDVLGVTG